MNLSSVVKLVLAIPFVSVASCHSNTPSWGDLENNIEKYNGKMITVCGWFREGFEVCTLSSEKVQGYGGKGMVWVSADDDSCSFEKPKEVGGWAIVTGTYNGSKNFPHSGFGHMGGYEAEITEAKIVRLEHACD